MCRFCNYLWAQKRGTFCTCLLCFPSAALLMHKKCLLETITHIPLIYTRTNPIPLSPWDHHKQRYATQHTDTFAFIQRMSRAEMSHTVHYHISRHTRIYVILHMWLHYVMHRESVFDLTFSSVTTPARFPSIAETIEAQARAAVTDNDMSWKRTGCGSQRYRHWRRVPNATMHIPVQLMQRKTFKYMRIDAYIARKKRVNNEFCCARARNTNYPTLLRFTLCPCNTYCTQK